MRESDSMLIQLSLILCTFYLETIFTKHLISWDIELVCHVNLSGPRACHAKLYSIFVIYGFVEIIGTSHTHTNTCARFVLTLHFLVAKKHAYYSITSQELKSSNFE